MTTPITQAAPVRALGYEPVNCGCSAHYHLCDCAGCAVCGCAGEDACGGCGEWAKPKPSDFPNAPLPDGYVGVDAAIWEYELAMERGEVEPDYD